MIREAEQRGEIADKFDLEFAVNGVKAYFVDQGPQYLASFAAGIFLVEVTPKVADPGNIMLGDIRMKANRLWCRVRFVRFQISLLGHDGPDSAHGRDHDDGHPITGRWHMDE